MFVEFHDEAFPFDGFKTEVGDMRKAVRAVTVEPRARELEDLLDEMLSKPSHPEDGVLTFRKGDASGLAQSDDSWDILRA